MTKLSFPSVYSVFMCVIVAGLKDLKAEEHLATGAWINMFELCILLG